MRAALGNLSLLSFDMGGTTAKAALVDSGQFLRVNSLEVGGGINIAGRLLSGAVITSARPRSTSPKWAPAAAASRDSMRAAGCASAPTARGPRRVPRATAGAVSCPRSPTPT